MRRPFRHALSFWALAAIAALPAAGQETWSIHYQGGSEDTTLKSIYFTGGDTGYAVGHYGKILKHTPEQGWHSQFSGVTNHLHAVHFPTKTTGYAVGASGMILKTTNGGNSWVLKPSGTTQELRSVYFTSANSGYAVGTGGTILKTTDGGTNWSEKIYENAQSELNAIQMIDENKGFIAAYYNNGFILMTTDAGENWSLVPNSGGSSWRSIHFPSPNIGYVTGGGGSTYFSKTSDGGLTWSEAKEIPAPGGGFTPSAIRFINNDTGYVGGNGVRLAKTTNGGATWSHPIGWTGGGISVTSLYFTSPIMGYATWGSRILRYVYYRPDTPQLSVPAENARNTALGLNLSWGVLPAATSFRVQVSKSPTFSSIVHDDSTLLTAVAYVENLDTNTTYYWRVNAKNPGGTSEWSSTRMFTTMPLKPDAVTLTGPLAGAINSTLSPTLSWSTMARAETYHLQLSSNPAFTALLKDTTQAGTSLTLVPRLTNNTTYYWRVRAANDGGTGDWSETRTFTTVPVPAAPSLNSPALGAVDVALSPTLEWSASEHALTYRVQISTDPAFGTTLVNDSTLTVTTRAVGPLSHNTTYHWRVNAKNGGTSGYSGVGSFTTLPAPPATPALSAPAASAINVPVATSLTWGAVAGAVNYHVQFSTDANFTTMIVNDSTLTETTRNVSSLATNGTYYWRVRAKNTGGVSAFSATRSFTTVPPIPPVPGLSAPAAGAADVAVSTNISWVAAAGATAYTLQLGLDETFATTLVNDSTLTTTSRAVSGLLNNTTYYWRVSARNPGGHSAFTPTRSFTTALVPLPGLTAPADNAAHIAPSTTLTWSAVGGITGYHVQLASDALFATLIVNDSGLTSTSRAVGPLAAGASYFWRVRAKAAGGLGAWTATARFTVMSAPAAPLLVSPGADSLNVPTTTQLVWQAGGTAASYRVQLASDSLFASLVLDDSSLTATSRATGTLRNAATYYWRVNARNAAGTGAFSPTRRFTTVALAVPTLTTPSANAVNVAARSTFAWSAVGDATDYVVQVSANSDFSTFVVNAAAATTSLQIGPLTAGATYYWRVRARNAGADGAFSAQGAFSVMALPAVPTLTSPQPDSTQAPTTLALTWGSVPGAATYHLQVSTDSLFAATLVNDSTLATPTHTVGPLTENTTYYWRVSAKNAGGTSAYSPLRRFTTFSPTSLTWARLTYQGPGITASASLRYRLPDARNVRIRLHNARGEKVAELLNEGRAAGAHELPMPTGLSQGIYMLEFRAGDYRQLLKLVR